MPRLLVILGTRPEAIKLCPVILALRRHAPEFNVAVCVTAQHRELMDGVLRLFDVRPDFDLDLMQPGQTLFQSTARIVGALEQVMSGARPDMVLVQGDTTTTLCGALAGFYAGAAVGHVEAGLRTNDKRQPFPEEINRVLTTRLGDLHFAATAGAADNLRAEGVGDERIVVTGNPGIDGLLHIRDLLESGSVMASHELPLDWRKKLILVTAHRRESFAGGLDRIWSAISTLARRPDVQVVYPMHPNPQVRAAAGRFNEHEVLTTGPLDYADFIDLMRRAHLIITDSGGVQEEGPSLGKPVLVTREKTERPEAVEAGTVMLVGTDVNRIVSEAERLLDDEAEYRRMSAIHNPYGDGHAGEYITNAIRAWFERLSQPHCCGV